ncbi:MAG TPA: PilZ domain-containing protein [Candidatus Polarisedimenticolia bacterium]|nr:PilZ domain-containing protein [Candidatus Polarisedimenticolia bacterium]
MRQAAASERRRIDRDRRRVSVRYGEGKHEFLGYTCDLAESGMFLQGVKLFPPNTQLSIELELAEGSRRVKGVVRWVKEVPPAFRRSLRGGMGIEFQLEK